MREYVLIEQEKAIIKLFIVDFFVVLGENI